MRRKTMPSALNPSSFGKVTARQRLGSFLSFTQLRRLGLFVVLIVCSETVFLLGANYYKLFPTNGNSVYNASLTAIFLVAAMVFKLNKSLAKYWQVSYAFFIASAVNLVSVLLGKYLDPFLAFLGTSGAMNSGLALGKLYDTLLVVIPILALTLVSGTNLGSLYLQVGNLSYKWGLGIGALVVVNYFTSVLIFFGTSYKLSQLGSVILWGIVFAFSNSLLEELWVRGLFLRKLTPLFGTTGAILLTSITFASLHFLGIAYLPAATVPIFVLNTFTLGLACSILMVKTDSVWGAYLIHAAADLFLFIATLAFH
jgi:membrane protease YdiL (CAAX protease family)